MVAAVGTFFVALSDDLPALPPGTICSASGTGKGTTRSLGLLVV
jgi:hypothetical protein